MCPAMEYFSKNEDDNPIQGLVWSLTAREEFERKSGKLTEYLNQPDLKLKSETNDSLPEEEEQKPDLEGLSEDGTMENWFSENTNEDTTDENSLSQNGTVSEDEENYLAKTRQEPWVEDLSLLKDFDYLTSHLYAVDDTTSTSAEQLNAAEMILYEGAISTDNSVPQILIYHTHSQEAFADSVPGDESMSVVGVGERLAQCLRDEYGFNVIHHTGVYDGENRDYAYQEAAPHIEALLEENPTVEVVIDLHRDGVADSTHLVTEVDGRKTAQFMFFNGLSYLKGKGGVSYLKNKYIKENLAFSFQMQLAANRLYPGFARKIYLKGLRYNMHYCPKSLLIEVGAQTNTVEEVMNAVEPLAKILASVLRPE